MLKNACHSFALLFLDSSIMFSITLSELNMSKHLLMSGWLALQSSLLAESIVPPFIAI